MSRLRRYEYQELRLQPSLSPPVAAPHQRQTLRIMSKTAPVHCNRGYFYPEYMRPVLANAFGNNECPNRPRGIFRFFLLTAMFAVRDRTSAFTIFRRLPNLQAWAMKIRISL